MSVYRYFAFFYGYLGFRLFPFLLASIAVALLDGIGLTMLLPLLYSLVGDDTAGVDELGWLLKVFEGVGVPVTLSSVLALMVAFFSFKGIAKFLTQSFASILNQRFGSQIRLHALSLLSEYSYQHFMRADGGRIQNTIGNEVVSLTRAFYNYMQTLQAFFMTVVYVALAYLANPQFALFVAVGGVLSHLIFGKLYRSTLRTSQRVTQGMHSLQGYLMESVSAFKYLKATGAINQYRHRMEKMVVTIEAENRKIGHMNALSNAVREPVVVVIVAGAILVQAHFLDANLSLILLSLLFFYRALSTLVATQSSYTGFLAGAGSIANMESFSRELSAQREAPGTTQFRHLHEKICVKGLNFSYGSHHILRDLSFTIRKNETIAIVGESGSGKTTLANLICGLLPAPHGAIFFDGVDINEIEKQSFRKKVGYVTQEPQMFTDTIRNNVNTWDRHSFQEREKVQESLRAAHAADFVATLPDQEETMLGFGGVNLSGGQRQRIAIARELYRETDLLIFDEATSALDTQSEQLVQENIDSLKGSTTLLIIAHRLSTIHKADTILFLQGPGKFDFGSFEELRLRSAAFRQMISLQLI